MALINKGVFFSEMRDIFLELLAEWKLMITSAVLVYLT